MADFDFLQRGGVNPLMDSTLRQDPEAIRKSAEARKIRDFLAEREAQAGAGGGGFVRGLGSVADLAGFAKAPAAYALDSLLETADQKSRLPGAEGDVSMIPTRANLARFLNKMKSVPASIPDVFPSERLAEKYARVRYPLRMEKAGQVYPVTDPRYASAGIQGFFDPEKNTTHLTIQRPSRGKKNAINTMVHEAQHSLDLNRPASGFDVLDFIAEERGGRYKTARRHGMNTYMEQPVEKRAFKAGDTAAAGYDKFLDIIDDFRPKAYRKKYLASGEQDLEKDLAVAAAARNKVVKELKREGASPADIQKFKKNANKQLDKQRDIFELMGRNRFQGIPSPDILLKRDLPNKSPEITDALARTFGESPFRHPLYTDDLKRTGAENYLVKRMRPQRYWYKK